MTTNAPSLRAWRNGWTQPGRADLVFYPALVAVALLLWWLCHHYPAMLPWWMPWEFRAGELFAAALSLWWYFRGVGLMAAEEQPSGWRQAAFAIGVVAIYGVLQTRYEYLAQHMFFFNRAQHLTMHHMGPFLIALAWPGAAIDHGMPDFLRRFVRQRAVLAVLELVQQPVLATVLFVGLIALWLYPPVHFRAMLDLTLYDVMNWSMFVDGVLFWCLVLDPRPAPAARVSFGARAAMVFLAIFPQIAMGAAIVFTNHDIYPSYDLCGRIFPAISAVYDQMVGGLIVWIPGSMMSLIGLLCILNNLRRSDDRMGIADGADDAVYFDASSWTG